MILKKDSMQCEADERALEICVDLGEGGADVGGGIQSDERESRNQGLDRHESFKSVHHRDCDGTRPIIAAMLVRCNTGNYR